MLFKYNDIADQTILYNFCFVFVLLMKIDFYFKSYELS